MSRGPGRKARRMKGLLLHSAAPAPTVLPAVMVGRTMRHTNQVHVIAGHPLPVRPLRSGSESGGQ